MLIFAYMYNKKFLHQEINMNISLQSKYALVPIAFRWILLACITLSRNNVYSIKKVFQKQYFKEKYAKDLFCTLSFSKYFLLSTILIYKNYFVLSLLNTNKILIDIYLQSPVATSSKSSMITDRNTRDFEQES